MYKCYKKCVDVETLFCDNYDSPEKTQIKQVDMANNARGFYDINMAVNDLKRQLDCLLYTSPSPRDRG